MVGSSSAPLSPASGSGEVTTVDRQCGSSQQAAHFAAQGVISGAYDIVIAAGSRVLVAPIPGLDDVPFHTSDRITTGPNAAPKPAQA